MTALGVQAFAALSYGYPRSFVETLTPAVSSPLIIIHKYFITDKLQVLLKVECLLTAVGSYNKEVEKMKKIFPPRFFSPSSSSIKNKYPFSAVIDNMQGRYTTYPLLQLC